MSKTETPATLEIMSALLEVGSAGATREHLVRRADVGTSTFYRTIKTLLERGLVIEQDHRYVMPLSQPYNFRFKQWQDMQRLYELPEVDRNNVLDISLDARTVLGDNLLCLWLVGSAASGELTPDSDYDFLAVLRKNQPYQPASPRNVNFVRMTEAEFRNHAAHSGDFVQLALQYGILLVDRDFVQSFHEKSAQSVPVRARTRFHEKEEALEELRERFLFLVEKKSEEAAHALSSLAVYLTRLMLTAFGEIPRDKPELLQLSSMIFGDHFTDTVSRVVKGQYDAKPPTMIALGRRLYEYYEEFSKQRSHLQSFSVTALGVKEMEAIFPAILRELFAGLNVLVMHEPHDIPEGVEVRAKVAPDALICDARGPRFAVEMKSLARTIDESHLVKMKEQTKSYWWGTHPPTLIMVVNAYRDVPLLQRPEAFSKEVLQFARRSKIHLWTALDLVQTHNIMHLDNLEARQCVLDRLKLEL